MSANGSAPEMPIENVGSVLVHDYLRKVMRPLSRIALAACVGIAAPVAVAPPAQATTFVNDYPDGSMPCEHSPYNVTGACANYDWGPTHTEAYNDPSENSSRGYAYRNCTDGAAYWVEKYTGVKVGAGLGDAASWDNNAASHAGWTVFAGSSNGIEPGDIAQSDGGSYGHVGFVTDVARDSSGTVTSISTAEMNAAGTGLESEQTYSTKDSTGKFKRTGTTYYWDHFIDVNGIGKGLNNENLAGSASGSFPSTGDLSFVRLNHYSGNVEIATYAASLGYSMLSAYNLSTSPDLPIDGSVVPIFKPNGDLSFVNLNYGGGDAQVVTYSAASNYQTIVGNNVTAYPDVGTNAAVKPMFNSNGDLSFVRLDYWAGNVQDITYSAASGYQSIVSNYTTAAPDMPTDGTVVVRYKPNNDLSFIRLNDPSGNVQVLTYAANTGYGTIAANNISAYPDVPADGAVVPLLKP